MVTKKAYFLIDIFMDPTSIDFWHDFLKAIVLYNPHPSFHMQISLQSPYANFQCKVQSKRIQKLKFKQILFEKYDARYLSHMPKSYSKACQDITNDKLYSPM